MERSPLSENSSYNDFITDVSGMTEIPLLYGRQTTSENSNVLNSSAHKIDSYKLGNKYRKKMNLNDEQCLLLDSLSFNNNVFNEIEYCRVQILKQFLRAIDFLYKNCTPVNRAYSTVIQELTEIIIVLEYNYKSDSLNYKYTSDSIFSDILNHILKLCENNVRDHYDIKRKINSDFKYTKPEILDKFNKKVVSQITSFLDSNQHLILEADYRTNLILNESNTNRWKTKFEIIRSNFINVVSFESEISRLAEVNAKNPSLDSLFFEASKFISSYDRNSALRLYIQYVDKDLNSQKFDKKLLNKSIQKSLFNSPEQFDDFENIINEFVQHRDLNLSIEKLDRLYLPKRKKIKIDTQVIEQVKKLDSEIAQKLGELLSEEDENQANSQLIDDQTTVNIAIVISNVLPDQITKYLPGLNLNEVQRDVLDLFEKNSFTILNSDFSDYAKSRQLFSGATIESINEKCFELLDDLLIEEEDDYFTINQDYFKKLLNND